MTNWSDYPKAMLAARAKNAHLEEISPGITAEVVRELENYGADVMAGAIAKFNELGLFGNDYYTEGVDSSPEAIEQIRTELAEYRNRALGAGEMTYAVLMSHVISMLAELAAIKKGHAKLPGVIQELKEQVREEMEKE